MLGFGKDRALYNKLQCKWCWLYAHTLFMHLATEAIYNAFTLSSAGHQNTSCRCNRLHTPGCLLSLSLFNPTKYNSFCIHLDYGEGEQCKAEMRNTDQQCSMKRDLSHSVFLWHRMWKLYKKQYKHRQRSRSQISCWCCWFPQHCRICSLIAPAREKGTQEWKLVIEIDGPITWKVFAFLRNVTKTTCIAVFTQQPDTSLHFVRRYGVIIMCPI